MSGGLGTRNRHVDDAKQEKMYVKRRCKMYAPIETGVQRPNGFGPFIDRFKVSTSRTRGGKSVDANERILGSPSAGRRRYRYNAHSP